MHILLDICVTALVQDSVNMKLKVVCFGCSVIQIENKGGRGEK